METGPKRNALRMCLGAAVVVVGVLALLKSLDLVLDHYPVAKATVKQTTTTTRSRGGRAVRSQTSTPTTQATDLPDRSASVVAVMAPIVAGVIGIVGLYFGISATGSARGRQTEALVAQTQALTEATKRA